MADVSPAKWHLAHTTWFFETFVLASLGELPLDPGFDLLFNSYYETVGAHVERARRGLLSRPALSVVHAYRHAIDVRIEEVLAGSAEPLLARIELGLQHEQQHQELLLTDIKHVLGTQPMRPAYRADLARPASTAVAPLRWIACAGGTVEIGAAGRDALVGGAGAFAFDCERPRHRVLLAPYRIAARPICNAEVLGFIADRGYREPRLWLSDGFALARGEDWAAPLYWEQRDGEWWHYTLAGMREVDPAETACHLSYYEADAIARWAGARLPTEAEWEHASSSVELAGNFVETDALHPTASEAADEAQLRQLFGDVWEWTQSAFAPYPGFRPLPGALGEYNGKFMANQLVLRGGSCFTPRDHIRASYRNFFAPSARWQMTGARLAMDGEPS